MKLHKSYSTIKDFRPCVQSEFPIFNRENWAREKQLLELHRNLTRRKRRIQTQLKEVEEALRRLGEEHG